MRVGLVVGLVLTGAGIMVVGAVLPEDWSYWSGVASNVGTTLLLASGLVFVERHFFRRVATTQADAAATAVAEAVGAVEERIESRLASLDDRLGEMRRERDSERDARIALLGQDVSFKSVADALRTASEAHAIRAVGTDDRFSVVVPSGPSSTSPRIGFGYRWAGGFDHEEWDERITLTFLPSSTLDQTIHVGWEEGAVFEEALTDLIDAMRAGGEGRAAKALDSAQKLITNLRDALVLAQASKRGDEGGWLKGRTLAELLWNGWTVTDAGLQRPGSGQLVIDGESFPSRIEQGQGFQPISTAPQRPSGVSEEDWEVLREVTRSHFFFRADRDLTGGGLVQE